MCDCIDHVNAKLRQFGGEVLVNLLGPERVFISTHQPPPAKGTRRKKLPLVAATFCPFCGTAYPEAIKTEAA